MSEEQRKVVDKVVRKVLDRRDETAVALLSKYLDKGYDCKKLAKKLYEKDVCDAKMASKLADDLVHELATGPVAKKRQKFEEKTADDKRDNNDTGVQSPEHQSQNGVAAAQRGATGRAGDSKITPGESLENELKAKQLMVQAQKTIGERLKQMKLPAPTPLIRPVNMSMPKLSSAEAKTFMNQAMEKQNRAAQLRAKIASKLPAVLGAGHAQKHLSPLALLEQGAGSTSSATTTTPTLASIDGGSIGGTVMAKIAAVRGGTTTGGASQELAGLPKQTPTLKANIRAEKRELFRWAQLETELMEEQGSKRGADSSTAAVIVPDYVDPRVSQKNAIRSRRQFAFHEKGEFEQMANRQRAKAKLEKLQSEISQAAKNTGISSAVKLAMVAPVCTDSQHDQEIPDIEWWDAVILDGKDYSSVPSISDDSEMLDTSQAKTGTNVDNISKKNRDNQNKNTNNNNTVDISAMITNLVEHPIQLKPPDEPLHPRYLKVFLTRRERKKIRRQNRKEAQREKTEKIRLGLDPAPEPKMKISNLMRVLGTDAVQDPTKMEAHVRKQMAARIRKHEKANAKRKLTKKQRSLKKIKKVQEDVSLGVQVVVFRVKSLAHPAKKFKVEMNAKQMHMTGIILVHKDMNVIVIEGGPKQVKFYKQLMLNRIKWEDEIIGQKKDATDRGQEEGERNRCTMIWEGVVKRRHFGEIRVKTVALEKQARDLLDKHGVAHYWDMIYSGAVLAGDQTDEAVV